MGMRSVLLFTALAVAAAEPSPLELQLHAEAENDHGAPLQSIPYRPVSPSLLELSNQLATVSAHRPKDVFRLDITQPIYEAITGDTVDFRNKEQSWWDSIKSSVRKLLYRFVIGNPATFRMYVTIGGVSFHDFHLENFTIATNPTATDALGLQLLLSKVGLDITANLVWSNVEEDSSAAGGHRLTSGDWLTVPLQVRNLGIDLGTSLALEKGEKEYSQAIAEACQKEEEAEAGALATQDLAQFSVESSMKFVVNGKECDKLPSKDDSDMTFEDYINIDTKHVMTFGAARTSDWKAKLRGWVVEKLVNFFVNSDANILKLSNALKSALDINKYKQKLKSALCAPNSAALQDFLFRDCVAGNGPHCQISAGLSLVANEHVLATAEVKSATEALLAPMLMKGSPIFLPHVDGSDETEQDAPPFVSKTLGEKIQRHLKQTLVGDRDMVGWWKSKKQLPMGDGVTYGEKVRHKMQLARGIKLADIKPAYNCYTEMVPEGLREQKICAKMTAGGKEMCDKSSKMGCRWSADKCGHILGAVSMQQPLTYQCFELRSCDVEGGTVNCDNAINFCAKVEIEAQTKIGGVVFTGGHCTRAFCKHAAPVEPVVSIRVTNTPEGKTRMQSGQGLGALQAHGMKLVKATTSEEKDVHGHPDILKLTQVNVADVRGNAWFGRSVEMWQTKALKQSVTASYGQVTDYTEGLFCDPATDKAHLDAALGVSHLRLVDAYVIKGGLYDKVKEKKEGAPNGCGLKDFVPVCPPQSGGEGCRPVDLNGQGMFSTGDEYYLCTRSSEWEAPIQAAYLIQVDFECGTNTPHSDTVCCGRKGSFPVREMGGEWNEMGMRKPYDFESGTSDSYTYLCVDQSEEDLWGMPRASGDETMKELLEGKTKNTLMGVKMGNELLLPPTLSSMELDYLQLAQDLEEEEEDVEPYPRSLPFVAKVVHKDVAGGKYGQFGVWVYGVGLRNIAVHDFSVEMHSCGPAGLRAGSCWNGFQLKFDLEVDIAANYFVEGGGISGSAANALLNTLNLFDTATDKVIEGYANFKQWLGSFGGKKTNGGGNIELIDHSKPGEEHELQQKFAELKAKEQKIEKELLQQGLKDKVVLRSKQGDAGAAVKLRLSTGAKLQYQQGGLVDGKWKAGAWKIKECEEINWKSFDLSVETSKLNLAVNWAVSKFNDWTRDKVSEVLGLEKIANSTDMFKLNSAGGTSLGEWLTQLGAQERGADGKVVKGPELSLKANVHLKNGALNHELFDPIWINLETTLHNTLLRTARFDA